MNLNEYSSKLEDCRSQIEILKSRITANKTAQSTNEPEKSAAISQNDGICREVKSLLANRANKLANLRIDEDNYCIRQAVLTAEIAILSLIVDACCIAGVVCDLLKALQKERALRLFLLNPNSDNYCRDQAVLSAELAVISLLIDLFCCLL